MNEGAIILAPLPQADDGAKIRPAVLLRELPKFGDWLACGVSTQLHQFVPGFDELIGPAAAGFAISGLHRASVIRLGFLWVIPLKRIRGQVGEVSAERHRRLLENLAAYLLRVGKSN